MLSSVRGILLITLCAFLAPKAAWAEKLGMPDLEQTEQTCMPTATANLIVWFAHHGYPKLLPAGGTEDDRDWSVVQRVMTDMNARFDLGTSPRLMVSGIAKYIRDAGYYPDVEYRGLYVPGQAFNREWLAANDRPDTGFVLIFVYCQWDPGTRVLSSAQRIGHAVTLVDYEPDSLLIHDPAHRDDETGRKILTPQSLENATWQDPDSSQPADGLLLLTGSLLRAPDDNSQVVLAGAVRVTVHEKPPETEPPHPHDLVAANARLSWWASIFQFFFYKQAQ